MNGRVNGIKKYRYKKQRPTFDNLKKTTLSSTNTNQF